MANWSNPQLTSTYTNFLAEVKARDDDLAVQFSTGTISNQPDGAIKWDSSANIWKKWSSSGSSWGALTSTYTFPALTTTGTAGFGGNITITGTVDASSTVTGTAFIPDGSSVPARGFYLPAANRLGFSTSGTHRAALDSTGLKLGSGTASCKLDVDGGIKVAGGITAGSHGYGFGGNDTDGGMYSPADDQLTFKTNNTRRVTIKGNKVGINIDDPLTHLHLKNNDTTNETTFRIENDEGSFNLKADGDRAYYFADEHTFSSQVATQGNITPSGDDSTSINTTGRWATLNGTGLGINVIPTSYKFDVTGNARVTGNLTVTGTLSGQISGSATNCLNVDIASDSSGNAEHYVNFTDSQTGNQRIKSDGDFKYNPSTNTLTVGNLNVSGSGGGIIPIGGIIIWSGAANLIGSTSSGGTGSGWALCNGSNGTPNLVNRFVIGATNSTGDSTYPNLSPNCTPGGSAQAVVVTHTHDISSDGAHGHGVNDPGHLHSYTHWSNTASEGGDASNRSSPITSSAQNTAGNFTGISIVSGGGHNHNGAVQAPSGATAASNTANLPPYYALAYIMRTS